MNHKSMNWDGQIKNNIHTEIVSIIILWSLMTLPRLFCVFFSPSLASVFDLFIHAPPSLISTDMHKSNDVDKKCIIAVIRYIFVLSLVLTLFPQINLVYLCIGKNTWRKVCHKFGYKYFGAIWRY